MIRTVLLLLMLAGCTSIPTPLERANTAHQLVASASWKGDIIDTPVFSLQAYYPRSLENAETLTVYIEGDGLAWVGSTTISFDPTPIDPLALKLAIRDPRAAVYLARPCQYTSAGRNLECQPKYWTSHRFAAEAVDSISAAIDALKTRFDASRLVLVGYSGGGAVAALVAARRHDVDRLITVAGNLDHYAWTTAHRLSPLVGSLNPSDFAASLLAIPQVHFVGGKDKVVGESVAQSYADQFPPSHRPRIVVMPEFDHHCCWVEYWPIKTE